MVSVHIGSALQALLSLKCSNKTRFFRSGIVDEPDNNAMVAGDEFWYLSPKDAGDATRAISAFAPLDVYHSIFNPEYYGRHHRQDGTIVSSDGGIIGDGIKVIIDGTGDSSSSSDPPS